MPRFQAETSDREHEDFETLKGLLSANTKNEVFREAISALRWMVKQRIEGRDIASIEGDRIHGTYTSPGLDNVHRDDLLTIAELRKRAQETGKSLQDILEMLEQSEQGKQQ